MSSSIRVVEQFNEQNRRAISKDKIAVCEKTAGLRSGNSSDLDSACLKALVSVE